MLMPMPAISRPVAWGLIPSGLWAAFFALGLIRGMDSAMDSTVGNTVLAYTPVVAVPLVCLLASAVELRRGGGWRRCLTAGAVAGIASAIVLYAVAVCWTLLVASGFRAFVLNLQGARLPADALTVGKAIDLFLAPETLVYILVVVVGAGILGLVASVLVLTAGTVWRRRATV